MNDEREIRSIALAAAERMAGEWGSDLPIWTEAALEALDVSGRQTRRFMEPALMVSLGSLLVSAATLAWTIYCDIRSHDPGRTVAPAVLERKVRLDLEVDGADSLTPEQKATLIETVVAETLKQTVAWGEKTRG